MAVPANTEGKASPGARFKVPPAVVWNNMIDAGRAFADGQLSNGTPNPTRPRSTDIIKVRNDSGAARRRGEILRINGKAISTLTDESIWLLGVVPTDDGYFGILKHPVESTEVEALQVSGCCMALVNVTDESHTRAAASAGSYVLQSDNSGPIEILFAPGGTGEQTCVVRFGGQKGVLEHGIVTASLGCGWYTIEKAIWTGERVTYAECDPFAHVTGEGTDACGITIVLPESQLTGTGVFVLAYDSGSIVVPLIVGTDCLITNLGDVNGYSGEPVWQVVQGLLNLVTAYEEERDCCDGVGETGEETLLSRTPLILVGLRGPTITCGDCTDY